MIPMADLLRAYPGSAGPKERRPARISLVRGGPPCSDREGGGSEPGMGPAVRIETTRRPPFWDEHPPRSSGRSSFARSSALAFQKALQTLPEEPRPSVQSHLALEHRLVFRVGPDPRVREPEPRATGNVEELPQDPSLRFVPRVVERVGDPRSGTTSRPSTSGSMLRVIRRGGTAGNPETLARSISEGGGSDGCGYPFLAAFPCVG